MNHPTAEMGIGRGIAAARYRTAFQLKGNGRARTFTGKDKQSRVDGA